MIPWIQVYSNLIKHPKTTNLADELNLSSKDTSPNAVAAGMLVSLWLWAAQNATDGDLSGCSDRAIAEAAEYRKKPSVFVAALIKTRWLNADRKIHDWEEYAALLNDTVERQKENTRERVRKHRERKRTATATTQTEELETHCNALCNVTETLSNAPTLPNLTLPNLTIHNYDDGDSACARNADEDELAGIGLKPGEYLGVTLETVNSVKQEADRLMHTVGRKPTATDCRNVFCYSCRAFDEKQGIDRDAVELLEYAFEQAALSGVPGNWRYIIGVLETLSAREIQTREQAEGYDRSRREAD